MKFFLSSFIILLLLSCGKNNNTIHFPENENEFPEPNAVNINLPKPIKTFWSASTKGKPKARILKTHTQIFKNPTFEVNPVHALLVPLDSNIVQFDKLPSVSLNLKSLPSKKIKPEIVLLGTPKKVKAQIPVVENQFVNSILEIAQDQGLPGTSVHSIVQDKNGRLWMATDNGLCFFDGEFIYTYLKRTGISRDMKLSLCIDKNGHIWAAGNGVDEIIPEQGIVRHYGKAQGLFTNAVGSVFLNNNKQVFVTSGEGVDIIDLSTENIIHLSTKEGLATNYINKITQDKEGRLWFASNGGGVNIYDSKKQKIYSLRASQGLSNDDIRAVICDNAGNMWFGGWNGGVDKYNTKTGNFYHLKVKHGLAFSYIHSLIQDHKGHIWIGCQESGTDLFDPVNLTIEHIYGQSGIAKSTVYSLFEDNAHCIWMGTSSAGIVKYDVANGKIKNYNNKFWFARRPIMAIYEDKEENIWLSTTGEGIDIFQPKKNTLMHLFTGGDWTDAWQNYFLDDGYGHIYMGTEYRFNILNKKNGTLTSWDEDSGLISNRIRCAVALDGAVILGTKKGLDKYDTLTATFKHLDSKLNTLQSPVECMTKDAQGSIWIGTIKNGLYKYTPKTSLLYHFTKEQGFTNSTIYCLLADSLGCIWAGTQSDGIKKINTKNNTITNIGTENGLVEMTITSLVKKANKIYAGTAKGLSIIETINKKTNIKNFAKPQGLRAYDFNNNSAIVSKSGLLWWGIGDIVTTLTPTKKQPLHGKTTITGINLMGKELNFNLCKNFKTNLTNTDTIWAPMRDTFFFKNSIKADTGYLQTNKVKWMGTNDAYFVPQELVLPYHQNHITFHFTSNYLSNTDKTRYRFILQGIDKQWNGFTNNAFADYRNLPPGNYVFKVTSNNFGNAWGKPAQFSFTITPPWWKTNIAYACYILFFIALSFGYNRIYTSRLRLRQKELEEKVDERTQQIVKQKNEIEIQKHTVEEKQKEIVDSINYAKRIQYTLLADEQVLKNNFADYFVLFQPKDIVSGDFYWATSVKASNNNAANNYFYLAVCDSTGHGVPGAFMSILNISFINEAINEKHILAPHQILNYVREQLIKSISRDGGQDGMDGVLLCIQSNSTTNEIEHITYAAANNSPMLFSNNTLVELQSNKMPIGKGEKTEPFTLFTINAVKGNIIYLYTDGFADQFGGPKGKKFKYKKLNELLLTNINESMDNQKKILLTTLNGWKGELEQVDDVCLLGIKL